MSSLRERSLAVFPAGSNGEFDLPPELAVVVRRGRGCELWDSEGRRFLDFSMGWGSVLVGHAHPAVVRAVAERAPLGANFATVTEDGLLLAEEILRASPACQALRFCASGSEATLTCLRIARAASGRSRVLKFEGAYHGAHEVGVASLFPEAPPRFPVAEARGAGLGVRARDEVLVAPFNDLAETERILREWGPELAAVIVEPFQRCLSPAPGFLAGLRERTREHGVLLIFDEVVTGFRLAYGGAQEYYGVVPDLVAYGKALGGGTPIGAFGGRRDLMDRVREERRDRADYCWTASTLGGNPISCAAARATLGVLRGPGVYPRLHALGERLRGGLAAALAERSVEGQVLGDGPLAQVVLGPGPVVDYRSSRRGDRAAERRLMLELFARGVFLNPMGTKLYLSLAHDEAACDAFLERFREALTAALAGGPSGADRPWTTPSTGPGG